MPRRVWTECKRALLRLILWRLVPNSVTVFEREIASAIHDGHPLLSAAFLDAGGIVTGGLSKKLVLHDGKSKEESELLVSKHGCIRRVVSSGGKLAVGYDYGCVEVYDERKIAPDCALFTREIEKGDATIFDLKASEEGFVVGHEHGIDMVGSDTGRSFNLLQTVSSVRSLELTEPKQVVFSCDGFGTLGRATWKLTENEVPPQEEEE